MYLDSYPIEKIAFFVGLMPEMMFEALKTESDLLVQDSPVDYKLTELYLQQKIKELEGG